MCLLSLIFAGVCLTQTVCGQNMYNMYADLNMGGVRGVVMFQQKDKLNPVLIKVQMETYDTGPWAIHEYPFIHRGNVEDSCSDLGAIIDHGDLTRSHEFYGYRSTYVDPDLRLFGSNTLLGRSLAIYIPGTSTIRACANILEFNSTMLYASAVLHGAIGGKVTILRSAALPDSPAIILGELFYVDGSTIPTNDHKWYIGSSGLESYENCSTVGDIFGIPSKESCGQEAQQECAMGDLFAKHGSISIGIAGSDKTKRRRFRFVDSNLRITPPSSILANGLTVLGNGRHIGCGDFISRGPMIAEATFESSTHTDVSGSILFRQSTPYHATKIRVHLDDLDYQDYSYGIHELPVEGSGGSGEVCSPSNVGSYFNPKGINSETTSPAQGAATVDTYQPGDLSGKFGTIIHKHGFLANFSDLTLSLYGRNSILGRALVITENFNTSSSRSICSNILPKASVKLTARADFTASSSLEGFIDLEQYIQSNGVTTEAGITVSLSYKGEQRKVVIEKYDVINSFTISTFDHNWHVHTHPVGNDSLEDISTRCASVKAHYNPFNVSVDDNYSSECSPDYHLRCELGDISSRQAKYDVGAGKKYFVDEDFVLFGAPTVIGRSFTIHEENGGHGRIACANIAATDSGQPAKIAYDYSPPKVQR